VSNDLCTFWSETPPNSGRRFCFVRDLPNVFPLVMRGLDPRIHRKMILFDGLPRQARQ
jgi:hypothetical protein